MRCVLPDAQGRMWSGGEHALLVWDQSTGDVIKELGDKGTVLALEVRLWPVAVCST